MVKSAYSTSEKLVSRNPALRREGQRELAKQTKSEQQETVTKARQITTKGHEGTISYRHAFEETKGVTKQTATQKTGQAEIARVEASKLEAVRKAEKQQQQMVQREIGRQYIQDTSQLPRKEDIRGTYTASPPLTMGAKAERYFQRARYREKSPLKKVPLYAGALGYGVISGAKKTLKYAKAHPVKSTLFVASAVVAPRPTAVYSLYKIYTEPETIPKTGTEVSEAIGSVLITGGAIKGVGRISTATGFKPALETYKVGETRGVGARITETKGTPLVSYTKGAKVTKMLRGAEVPVSRSALKDLPFSTPKPRIDIGTPKRIYGVKEPYQPLGTAETTIFKKRAGQIITEPTEMLVEGKKVSPKLQQEFAVKGIEALREQSRTLSKYYSKEALTKTGTKYLSPTEAGTIFTEIGKTKGKVFGSFPARAELKPSLIREVGDIEALYKTSSEKVLATKTQQILTELKKKSPEAKFRILEEEPFHIEKQVKGQWVKVAEFKGKGIGEGDVAPEKALGFDLWSAKDFKKREGVSTALLRGETKRKGAGSIAIRQPSALGVAHTGRFKDVPDFFRYIETLAERRKLSPKAKALLELKEPLGIKYGKEPPKFEIKSLKKPSAQPVSPAVVLNVSPSLSPSSRPSGKPSVSILPSPLKSPKRSPSRKPSPSAKPSPSLVPSSKVSPSAKGSPSLSPSAKVSVSLSPKASAKPSSLVSVSSKASSLPSPSNPLLPDSKRKPKQFKRKPRTRKPVKKGYTPTLIGSFMPRIPVSKAVPARMYSGILPRPLLKPDKKKKKKKRNMFLF